MSISLALDFQQNLHRSMDSDEELKSMVSNIYQSIKQYSKYPYILQHVNKVKLLKHRINSYEMEGEINIYIRESNFGNFKNIISRIEAVFYLQRNLETYSYISGRIIDAEFIPSQDLMTTRFKMGYQSLIQGRA